MNLSRLDMPPFMVLHDALQKPGWFSQNIFYSYFCHSFLFWLPCSSVWTNKQVSFYT